MRTCTLMVMQPRASTLAKQMLGAQVGNRVGVKRCSDDTMHIFIDGEDMGSAATAVAKVSCGTSGVSSPPVFKPLSSASPRTFTPSSTCTGGLRPCPS